ncbi:calpain-9 [Eurytemora carolleeae]|uniref:calpain-9 n=1 Tax=Eurytemora carolleeae TaxID=1294199 RepID=UPI000C7769E8|nr:calpain-9 [Eurytemora carolleeae]|eukprot:XP_023330872.1 calpain-9-like [Eurytemora affinis]
MEGHHRRTVIRSNSYMSGPIETRSPEYLRSNLAHSQYRLNRSTSFLHNISASRDFHNPSAASRDLNHLSASRDAHNLSASRDAHNLSASRDAHNLSASSDLHNSSTADIPQNSTLRLSTKLAPDEARTFFNGEEDFSTSTPNPEQMIGDTNTGSQLENEYEGRHTLPRENGGHHDLRQNGGYNTFSKNEISNGGNNLSRTGVSNGYKGTGMNGGRGVNGGLIKRELPEPPNLPPPDYNETMAARSKGTFGRSVTRHESARVPMVSVGIHADTRDARSDTDVPVFKNRDFSTIPGEVVFNTNEQKTATVGRVPRVNRMSSFYGDLNSSSATLERSFATSGEALENTKGSVRLSTVYRVGSLLLSEGVYGTTNKAVVDMGGSTPNLTESNTFVPPLEKKSKSGIIFGSSTQEYSGGGMRNWLSGWGSGHPKGTVPGSLGPVGPGLGPGGGLLDPRIDDKQSTLSRYWTMDRSLQRKLGKTNFQHIKRLCRDRGQLFEDQDFPPTNKAIYSHKKPHLHPIVWMRPHEICQRPKFIAEGATRFDVEQGELGDPWLLAAVSSLTLTPRFLDRVVPPDQNFEQGYCGVFRFRFWHFGDWVEVLVDDRLPTHKGRLVFLHSTDPAEFWAALLEKAYAKLYGCYEALHGGFTTKALQDLTGGIVQSFSLTSQDRLLTYQVLNSAVPRSTLLIASINMDKTDTKRQTRLRNGLVTRHAYSVTGLARVRGQLGDTHLVRLRNPWGRGEWNGPWSERSWEWDSLSERDKELLSVRVRNEGEFWMSFDDFAKQFSHLDLVHIGPDDWMSEPALHSKKPWRAVLARRRWRSGYNAGGGPGYIETTAMNPQFHIQIPRTGTAKCHVVVSVTQQYETNTLNNKKRRTLHHIGFAVYEVPSTMTRLTPQYVIEHKPLDVTNHSVAREVVTFFTLPPGEYIVMPQTNVPNCDGKFLLRILTDEQSNIWEVNEDNQLIRNVLVEFEDSLKYTDSRIILNRLVSKYPPDIDATILLKILKGHWKAYLIEKPSLELCRHLVMLRDYNISGRINLMEIPVLLHMLHFWKAAFLKFDRHHSGKTSSFNLRLILWEAGLSVSNKVLECLVLRFAKNRFVSSESYVTVMIRLHLAHERFHSIDTKMKGNPLSLEEMILMTIYS